MGKEHLIRREPGEMLFSLLGPISRGDYSRAT